MQLTLLSYIIYKTCHYSLNIFGRPVSNSQAMKTLEHLGFPRNFSNRTPSPICAGQPTTIVPSKHWQVAISWTEQQSHRKPLVKLPWKQRQQQLHCFKGWMLLHWMFWGIFSLKKSNQVESRGMGKGCYLQQSFKRWVDEQIIEWNNHLQKTERLCQNQNGKNHRLGCLDMYSSFLKHVITKTTRYQISLHLSHELFHRVIIHHTSSKGVKTFCTSPGNYIIKGNMWNLPFSNDL